MNTPIRFVANIFFIYISSFIISCFDFNTAGAPGTGSETTNGIVFNTDGTPAVNTQIYIRRTNYLTDTAKINQTINPDLITDSNGQYMLKFSESGDYTIEYQSDSNTCALLNLTVNTSGVADTLRPDVNLLGCSSISGIIERENISDDINIFVQIYGLEHIQQVNRTGEFKFKKVPAGKLRLNIISGDSTLGVNSTETIDLLPNQHKDIGKIRLPFETWRDTVVVRELLDSNGLQNIAVSEVTKNSRTDGRILDLELDNHGITTIPVSIGKLRIQNLFLGRNQLTTIPAEIGDIKSLLHIEIQGNNLSNLPLELFTIRELVHLDASDNQLSQINDQIENLSLKFLALKNNRLTSLPKTIDELRNLKHLNIDNNQIVSLPKSITKLNELNFLSLFHNKLCSPTTEVSKWIDNNHIQSDWDTLQDCP